MDNIRQMIWEAFGIIKPLDETILDKNVLKAIMLAGGPGSGKSHVCSKLAQGVYPLPKIIDSDKIFEAKLKANNLPKKLATVGSPERLEQVRQRKLAQAANIKVLNSLLNGFMPIIIDGTGKDQQKYTNQKKVLESLGYDVMCLMINTSLDVAQERNAKRERSLTPEEVDLFWHACQENFKVYPNTFNWSYTVNNDPGMLNQQELVSAVNKFLSTPVQNPIGKALFDAKDTGSITRKIDPTLFDKLR